jgi:hypothetical protein
MATNLDEQEPQAERDRALGELGRSGWQDGEA